MMLRYVGSEDSELSEHFTNGNLYIADKSELFSFHSFDVDDNHGSTWCILKSDDDFEVVHD